ncbi:MarR family transcriptional regulator [Candidatus Bipolaricaulota bacterium]|nr:MarR family transcriptional regulator [Candidatus Bipolaricaulota bacterium]
MKQQERQQFVEEFGDRMDEFGLPRMYGRVLGALLISGKPMLSMQELSAELQASHGSISMATQMLIRLGMIEKTSVPGERRHFYRVGRNAWNTSFANKLQYLELMLDLADRGLTLLDDAPEKTRESLVQMRSFFDFFRGEFEGIVERWERSCADSNSP